MSEVVERISEEEEESPEPLKFQYDYSKSKTMNRIQKNKIEMLIKLKLMQENKFSLPSDSFPTDGP